MGLLALHQVIGHHADRLAALGHDGIGQGPHQADGGPAVDQGVAATGEFGAEPAGGFEELRVTAVP